MQIFHLIFFSFVPSVTNAILCRICTNCETERDDVFSMCDSNQSCYTLHRVHSKMTEMGCGTSCSLVERARSINDTCHLCQYDKCNSGKKIIVRGDLFTKSVVTKNVRETSTSGSYIEREIEPFPVDKTNPLPIDMAFPHTVISWSEMVRLNGSLVSHSAESPPLPIPIDDSLPIGQVHVRKEEFIGHYVDILDDELDTIRLDLDSRVDNKRADKVREEEDNEVDEVKKKESAEMVLPTSGRKTTTIYLAFMVAICAILFNNLIY